MRFTQVTLGLIPGLIINKHFFSSKEFTWYKVLFTLTLNRDTLFWEEEIKMHFPSESHPLKCFLRFKLDFLRFEHSHYVVFEVALVADWAAITPWMR